MEAAGQAQHEGRALPTAVLAGEEPRFSAQSYAPERPFRRIVREADGHLEKPVAFEGLW